MKIDEAISLLKQYIDYNNPDIPDFYTMEEAIKVIIKALEQEPTDMISRQAVLEVIRKCHCEEWVKTDIGAPIEALPSVTPQQKMGRWITWKEAGNDIPSETRFECSVCHDAAQTLCNGLDLLSTYCPNCGAKMSEVEE